jgi:inosose dehydratase
MYFAQHMSNWSDRYPKNGRFHFGTMLDEIKAAGFQGVEVSGDLKTLGSPGEIKKQVAERDLEFAAFMPGVIADVSAFAAEAYRSEMAYAAELGIKVITLPGAFALQESAEVFESEYPVFLESIAKLCNYASENEQIIAYHVCHGHPVRAIDEIQRVLTDLPTLALCIDTGHCAAMQSDPVELIKLYPDRIAHIHLKDWSAHSQCFANIGEGDIGKFPHLLRALKHIGYAGWLTVETGDPLMPAGELAFHSNRFLNETIKGL